MSLRSLLLSTCLGACLAGHEAQAQATSGTLRGTVTDDRNARPLPAAEVELLAPDTTIRAATDADGHFRMDAVPVGIHRLRVTLNGFAPADIPEVWVRAGKEEVVDIALEPAVIELPAGEVVRQRKDPGAVTLTVEQTLRYPAAFFDPARVATVSAGVANINDQANHFSVRGNNPNGNAWLLEGAEMVNPNHLSNAGTPSDLPMLSGGGVNILSAQMLGTSRLLKGSWAPDRGNALGGIMDMELRRGNTSTREWTAQAGLIGLDLSTEGPLGKGGRSSYLVNYRYSTLGLLGAMGVDLGDEVITFQDLSFHVTLPLAARGELRFFGLGGNSSNVFEAQRDTSEWEFDKDGSDITYTARTGAAGTTARLPVGRQGSLMATVLLSATGQERQRIRLGDDLKPLDTTTYDLHERKLSTVVRYDGALTARSRWSLGASAMEREVTNLFDERITGWLVRPHLNTRWSVGDHWTVGLGVAYAHFTLTNSAVAEPRASLHWNMRNGRRLSASAGRRSQLPMHQLLRVRFTDVRPWNQQLGPTLSDEVVLAYDHPLNERLTFHLEVFHQQLSDLPERDPAYTWSLEQDNLVNQWDEPAIIKYLNTGRATNTGAEASLERTFARGFFYLVNATVYESRWELGGVEQDTRWNGRYIVNAAGGREFVKRTNDRVRTWGITSRLVLMGGARTTPIDVQASEEVRGTVPGGPAWSAQFDDLHRLDLRVYLKRERKGRTGLWALDLQNAVNAQNAAYQYYDVRKGEVVTKYQLGLIPNLSYRIEF